MGIIEPDKGSVLVDGVSISGSIKNWQNSIGYVSQNVFLIPSSIRKNIAFGIPEDKINENKISQAIQKSALKDFVDSLLNKVDTQIGEDGAMISGGQKQRIALARAILRDPQILLLDEATSALDTESERVVQAALARLKSGRTTIVIAHRLSTVADADLIYVLEDGRVIEVGTHAELLTRGEAYARVHALQFANQELEIESRPGSQV